MNAKLMIKWMFIAFVCFGMTGCTNDEDVEESLKGEWVEVYPQNERTTLIFTSGNKMTLIDGDGFSEIYDYRIEDDMIYLSLEGSEDETALLFDKLDPLRFNIGYLYPSIPESDPDKYMTFERI